MDRNIEKISLGNKHSVVWIHDVGEKQNRPLNGPFLNIEEGKMFFMDQFGGKTVREEYEENLHFH